MTALPPITITNRDHDKLSHFIERQFRCISQVTPFLERELGRAALIAPHEIPSDVVTMNSRVRFRMGRDGQSRTLTLVYPTEADSGNNRLSILTPVGVALLGLSEGQTMSWPDRTGIARTLQVEQVVYQPETDSRFDL